MSGLSFRCCKWFPSLSGFITEQGLFLVATLFEFEMLCLLLLAFDKLLIHTVFLQTPQI
jgi:hypothetical protein